MRSGVTNQSIKYVVMTLSSGLHAKNQRAGRFADGFPLRLAARRSRRGWGFCGLIIRLMNVEFVW
jgi:hypothetical protein